MEILEFKYAFLQCWEDKNDDRKIAFNMVQQILEAEKEREKLKNPFCRSAIGKAIAEQEKIIDSIIYCFTGLKWKNLHWEEEEG